MNRLIQPKKTTNPFINTDRAIDKADIMNALSEIGRLVHEAQVSTERAMRTQRMDDEVKWAMDISGLEITMTNVAEMLRSRFV